MDLTTIIGITGGMILVLVSVFVRGGAIALGGFINIPAVMITFGGTFAAILVNYTFPQVLNAFKIVKKVFTEAQENPPQYIEQFRYLIIKSSRQGVLSLQEDIKEMDNEFLRKGLKMVIDGKSQELIEEELETEIVFTQARHKMGQEIFVTLGTYAPAFGMIGTIMGLILMLADLRDPSQIAGGMAVALLTTFYGALAAYLIFLPVAGKLKRRSETEIFIKRVIIRGILSLQSGEIPSIAVAKLRAYMPRSDLMETTSKEEAGASVETESSQKPAGRKTKVKFKGKK